MRVAQSYDRAETSAKERQFKRIVSAIAKYRVCKRAPMAVAEALECLGGNGYVEESQLPRLFRESPLLGIWEGSGNVICLDVLRTPIPTRWTVLSKSWTALVAEIGATTNLLRR